METQTISYAQAPTGNEKLWSMLSHVSVILGVGIIVPLVVYLAMKQESEFIAKNAKEALNFHISLLIYVICCVPLTFVLIGIPLLIVLGVGSLILAIIATVKVSENAAYRYPMTLRLVK